MWFYDDVTSCLVLPVNAAFQLAACVTNLARLCLPPPPACLPACRRAWRLLSSLPSASVCLPRRPPGWLSWRQYRSSRTSSRQQAGLLGSTVSYGLGPEPYLRLPGCTSGGWVWGWGGGGAVRSSQVWLVVCCAYSICSLPPFHLTELGCSPSRCCSWCCRRWRRGRHAQSGDRHCHRKPSDFHQQCAHSVGRQCSWHVPLKQARAGIGTLAMNAHWHPYEVHFTCMLGR